MKPKLIFLILITYICITLTSCLNDTINSAVSLTEFYFDTVVTITIYEADSAHSYNDLIKVCFNLCSKYENIISKTIDTSDTSMINHSNGKPIIISTTESELIKKALYYSNLSNGAFDITIAPVSNLWNFKNNTGTVPESSEINRALQYVDYKNIHLEGTSITLLNANTNIDLGGIAKGYIADLLKEYLVKNGVTSAIIDLGGNILTIGTKPDETDFKIGIKKPFSESEFIAIVNTNDLSVVTSGVYERYFYVDNILYHHILDTSTGYPCDNGLYSVTIISKQSVDGDGLSTSCFAMGLEKGLELIESIDSVEAIFVDKNNHITLSSGLSIDKNDYISLK